MTVPKPTTAQANRALRMIGFGHLHITGNWSSSVTAKKIRPRTATGTPATIAYELVVTARQLTIPLSEQTRLDDPVKCS